MGDPEITQLLESIDHRQGRQGTAWDEVKVAGTELQEASTTTLPPNSRFGFIKNGNFLNADEVDSQVTHALPLYQVDLAAGDTWVMGGTDRNAYVPGFETFTGIAFQLGQLPADGALLPSDIDLLEAGYGTLHSTALTGVPDESFSYSKQGIVLHIESHTADIRVYRDGDPAVTLDRAEWDQDPFSLSQFQYDPSKFAVLRPSFDLYGGGSATIDMRLRNEDGKSRLIRLGEIGDPVDPLLSVYNHRMQLRVEAADTITGAPTASLGPVEFHNAFEGKAQTRNKTTPYRDVNISDAIGDDDWTVVRVFRLDTTRREAAVKAVGLRIEEEATGVDAQLRAVHRDHLTFPQGTDPDDDANWRAPGQSAVRETALEELEVATDSVTIATFTDDDDVTKIRGEKELTASVSAAQGAGSASRDAQGESPQSELLYLALVAQVGNTNENIDLLEIEDEQRW